MGEHRNRGALRSFRGQLTRSGWRTSHRFKAAMRLPRSRTLNRWSEFQRVRKEGQSHAGRHMVVGVLPVEEEDDLRIGFITTKRLGNAVKRNQIRRRLRAAVQSCPPITGYHYVVVARHPAGRATFSGLASEWRRLAGKAGVLESDPKMEGGAA